MTQQTITAIERFSSLVDQEGKTTQRGAEYLEEMTRQVNESTMVVATGSPEGVVSAVVGETYIDTAGGAGSTLYVKVSGVGNTGWLVV